MIPLLALAAGFLANPFHEADSTAWRCRVTFETDMRSSIPGADDFHAVDPTDTAIAGAETEAGVLGRSVRVDLYMPRRGPVSWFGGLALGFEEATWKNDVDYRAGGGYVAEMTLENMVLQLIGGAELRLARRHFLALEAVLPIAIGDGDLDRKVDGTKASDAAPSSFGLSMLPRLAVTYDYRLFDRIDLGLGYSFVTPGYFSGTPTLRDGAGEEVDLDSGDESGVISTRLGWTFGG